MKNILIGALIIVLLIFGISYFKNKDIDYNNNEQLPVYAAQIDYLEGDVEFKKDEEAGWFKGEKGELLSAGNFLRTLNNSRLIVTFEDGSILRLDENTIVKIAKNSGDVELFLDKGSVYNGVSKNDNRKYIVRTADYQVLSLGTEFLVQSDESGTEVMVVESKVKITGLKEEMSQTVSQGEKISINQKGIVKKKTSQDDLNKDFLKWNIQGAEKKEIKEKREIKKVEKKELNEKTEIKEKKVIQNNNPRIEIWGKSTENGVELNWNPKNVDVSKGFKLVKSEEMNPVYPGDSYKYISDSESRKYIWNIKDGKTYYFRVCQYLGGKCRTYSKNLKLKAPLKKDKSKTDNSSLSFAKSLNLTARAENGSVKLNWNVDGEAPKGFKVVKSEEINPVYPGNNYKYLSNSTQRSYTWNSDLENGKSYHFRVCVYKGNGVCGAYSNDVVVNL